MSVLVIAKFPSVAAVLMACAASLLLLFLARIFFVLMRLWSCPMVRPEAQEKETSFLSFVSFSKPWSNSLQWNTLPLSLPLSLRLPEKPNPEAGSTVGVGLSGKRPQTLPVATWQPRTGPQFQPPPPALYENPMPLSMAKIIMSRHTFRRPNPNRARRPSAASSSQPTSPPQTPSRLYHSIA